MKTSWLCNKCVQRSLHGASPVIFPRLSRKCLEFPFFPKSQVNEQIRKEIINVEKNCFRLREDTFESKVVQYSPLNKIPHTIKIICSVRRPYFNSKFWTVYTTRNEWTTPLLEVQIRNLLACSDFYIKMVCSLPHFIKLCFLNFGGTSISRLNFKFLTR